MQKPVKSVLYLVLKNRPDSLFSVQEVGLINYFQENKKIFLIFARVSLHKFYFCDILHTAHFLGIYFAELHRLCIDREHSAICVEKNAQQILRKRRCGSGAIKKLKRNATKCCMPLPQ